jgi:uncharacterized protein YbjT (DUF2867 family)
VRVTVLGATGGTGALVVREAVAAGHDVTVLVRDPARLTPTDGVRVVTGDARDPEAVMQAVAPANGLISAIGTRQRGRSTTITDCMATVVGALPAGTRLLAVSTVGAGGSGQQLPLPVRVLVTRMLRDAIADHDGQERVIMASDLDWTIARCVALTDGPPTGSVHELTEGRLRGSRIARADVARWLVDNLTDDRWSGRAVSLW